MYSECITYFNLKVSCFTFTLELAKNSSIKNSKNDFFRLHIE
nr:hypothetical protein [uncultured archaeon]